MSALPMDVLVLFKHGFPWNWIELLQVAAEQLVTVCPPRPCFSFCLMCTGM